MSKLELVKKRRSVRTFDGKDFSLENQEKILACAKASTNPYNIPIDWKILSAKADGLKSPVIAGTDCYISGKMKRVPHAEEAFGYSFENVVMYAAELGIGTTWIGGTMDREAFEKATGLGQDEVMPCVSPLGFPADKMALKEVMMRKGVKAETRLTFEEVFFCENFDTPMTEGKAGDLFEALEMVRWAPSAVNKQPWRLVFEGNMVHFYEKQNNGFVNKTGWDMQKIDIGIAMQHFAMGMEGKAELELKLEEPAIKKPESTIYVASFVIKK